MINPQESGENSSEDNEQSLENIESQQESVLSQEQMDEIKKVAKEAEDNEPQDINEEIEKIKEGMEGEQTPEEILLVLQEDAAEGRELNLTISRLDGTLDTGLGIPYFTDQGFYIETEYTAIPIDI